MPKSEKKTNSIKKGHTYLKIQSDDFHYFSNGMSDFIIQRIAVLAKMHLWSNNATPKKTVRFLSFIKTYRILYHSIVL